MPLFQAELKKISGDRHILSAVCRQLFHLSLAEPLHRLEPFRCLSPFQRLFCQMIQTQAKTQSPVHIFQYVKGPQAVEIHWGIGGQHLVIESLDVKANNEVRFPEKLEQGRQCLFLKDVELLVQGVVQHGHRDAHEVCLVPSPHILGCLLGFQVQINDPGPLLRLNRIIFFSRRRHGIFPFIGRDLAHGNVAEQALK